MPNNQHDLRLLEAKTLFANAILSGKGHPAISPHFGAANLLSAS
jgi:hypothetical protein